MIRLRGTGLRDEESALGSKRLPDGGPSVDAMDQRDETQRTAKFEKGKR